MTILLIILIGIVLFGSLLFVAYDAGYDHGWSDHQMSQNDWNSDDS